MRKIIVNENTVKLAQKQTFQTFKKVYLELQRYLLHCLEWAGENAEKKKDIKKQIKEVGETYKKTVEKLNNKPQYYAKK